MRALLFVVLWVAPAAADVAVAGRVVAGKATVCPVLTAGSVSARSAGEIEWSGRIIVEGGPARVKRSTVAVSNEAGRVVFLDTRAFHLPGDGSDAGNVGLGMSSSAGPVITAALPVGRYRAVWTVDDVTSNAVMVNVGPMAPPPVVLEQLDGPGCSPGLWIAHIYNAGPETVDILKGYEESTLIVDNKRFGRQEVEWNGGTSLAARHAWAFTFKPVEYDAKVGPGHHRIELEFDGRRSNPVEIKSR